MTAVQIMALIGVTGVSAQWLAWRFNMPAIVLMLVTGVLIGPGLDLFRPDRDIGKLHEAMVTLAVAIIMFEGGLSLRLKSLADAAIGVRRLIFPAAPLAWLFSTLALHYVAELSWASSCVFGGIMIVTGPTVIAPLLRQARLARRPAAMLQWEAIVNDPLGAMAAVLAFSTVMVLHSRSTAFESFVEVLVGISFALLLGFLVGRAIVLTFKRGMVPEYMKVPVMFVTVLGVFALADSLLHEGGLLAVTVLGMVIANADLPSYQEIRRFKEHATILLVTGVFIILAADLNVDELRLLDARAVAFVAVLVLVARPAAVLLSLIGTPIPMRERLLVAFTGPRGVVLMAVAGLFGTWLADLGIEDAHRIGPLAFLVVSSTVVLHGFTLSPLARLLGLRVAETPGVLIVGGSPFTAALGEALVRANVPVLVTDLNMRNLLHPRLAGLKVYCGHALAEAADQSLEMTGFGTLIVASDNDAYNTLVASDLAPEFGRNNVFQVAPERADSHRYALPKSLSGRSFASRLTYDALSEMMDKGGRVTVTHFKPEFPFERWSEAHPDAVPIATCAPNGRIRVLRDGQAPHLAPGHALIALLPARPVVAAPAPLASPTPTRESEGEGEAVPT
ncbi:cation:proton antiporter [Tabrizicola sp. J26]|uniref:cation:proton antiporter n=1 Tax=Alitabrizicola rongguiensis TaxID=2909234 RepID=UPI001F46D47A|nr:sodium:proton antiporter [Tabrizicola rongguiensis]MCF1710064.1 cation:proton antiporter [Tabrizicola rongguiensis]